MAGLFESKKTTESKQSGQVDPWAPTQPVLRDLIGDISRQRSTIGATPAQTSAIQTLEQQARAGNPYATQIGSLADKQFGVTSQAPLARESYDTFKTQLTPYANGSMVTANDPTLEAAIQAASTDVQDRINRQYAGAGRDLSGANAGAIAKGVASVALPERLDWIKQQQANQLNAAQSLYGAGQGTAGNIMSLDKAALDQNSQGIDTAKEYLSAQGWGPTQIANLEQQLKGLSAEDTQRVLSLILPIAQLGQQSQGQGTSTTTSTPSPLSMIGTGLSLGSRFGLI